jgi:hypothetical protein
MEHLFFEPSGDDPSEMKSAYESDILSMDWADMPDLIDFVPPETPWLGFEHDEAPRAQDLQDYPISFRWDTDQIWNGNLRQGHQDLETLHPSLIASRVASFLQAWLYYGLLETIVAKKIQVSYLMKKNTKNQETLYSRNLHFCLQARVFQIRMKLKDPNQKLATQLKMGKNLYLLRDWTVRLSTFSIGEFKEKLEKSYPGFLDLLCQITPAIVRLAEAIRETIMYVFEAWPIKSLTNLHIPLVAVESRRITLRSAGWCDFQLALLEDTTNQSTMDWLPVSQIQQDTSGHEDCTSAACSRNNVDVRTYKQKHHVPNCNCTPLFPDKARVMDILNEDKLPVISLEYHDGEPRLAVSAANKEETGDYVAVSHVWVDGLGGSTEQGLLCCQVLRLNALASKVMGRAGSPMKFWVDSLCIPRSNKQTYYKALIGIRDVYLCASTVIVVDRLIQKCSATASTEMIFAHIYMSAWMQRMWTYEEAVLAKELVFILENDEAYPYTITLKPTMRRTVSVIWRTLATQLFRLRAKQMSRLNIAQISLAFRYRLTNATGDEFLSVASMLGLDTGPLQEVKGEERVRDFWLMLAKLPSQVLFLDGPKLSVDGFRWAPKTLMFPTPTRMDPDPLVLHCQCTKEGLHGSFLYVHFDRILQGSNRGHGQTLLERAKVGGNLQPDAIFMIYIEGTKAAHRSKDPRTALRVYCTETWPDPPETLLFDGLILLTTNNVEPNPGERFPGVALLRDSNSFGAENLLPNAETVCSYVAKVLVERLRMEELEHPTPTIMYAGADYTVIDARAAWNITALRVT